jgi:hypothetical protein
VEKATVCLGTASHHSPAGATLSLTGAIADELPSRAPAQVPSELLRWPALLKLAARHTSDTL